MLPAATPLSQALVVEESQRRPSVGNPLLSRGEQGRRPGPVAPLRSLSSSCASVDTCGPSLLHASGSYSPALATAVLSHIKFEGSYIQNFSFVLVSNAMAESVTRALYDAAIAHREAQAGANRDRAATKPEL